LIDPLPKESTEIKQRHIRLLLGKYEEYSSGRQHYGEEWVLFARITDYEHTFDPCDTSAIMKVKMTSFDDLKFSQLLRRLKDTKADYKSLHYNTTISFIEEPKDFTIIHVCPQCFKGGKFRSKQLIDGVYHLKVDCPEHGTYYFSRDKT